MTVYRMPCTALPNQSFTCTIPRGKENLYLGVALRYNLEADYWLITLTNSRTQEVYISELPVLGGVYPYNDILRPYQYLGLGQLFVVPKDIHTLQTESAPNSNNLGTDWLLVWSDYNA